MMDSSRLKSMARAWLVAALGLAWSVPAAVTAQERAVPDTYSATTVNMEPAGVGLKIDVLEWSDEAARSAVIEAIAAEDPSAALVDLPTVGVVWRSGSAVGSALKYAHKTPAADGGERIVLVTDKALGTTSFKPWTASDAPAEELSYSVIELVPDPDGGTGTLSLAAEVVIDAAASTVSLERSDDRPLLLTEVKLEPKPYWADDG